MHGDNVLSHESSAVCFSEYLATFKKTVAMHEVFLQRIAAHPVLRSDVNFKVFLEYEQEVLLMFAQLLIFSFCLILSIFL